jgi:hypothetical protein
MTSAEEITVGGIRCRRLAAGRWSYRPAAPSPQRAPDGTALMCILQAGDTAFVQLSARLDPPAAVLERLRAQLTALDEAAVPVSLESAISTVERVDVVADPATDARTIATSTGSGFPPFTAVFSLMPQGDDLRSCERAFAGEVGRVEVRYVIPDAGDGGAALAADIATWPGAATPAASDSPVLIDSTTASPIRAASQEGTSC